MNLYLVVEGDRTEPRLYPAWMRHALPALSRVRSIDDVVDCHYLLVRGGGDPAYERVITSAVEDLRAHPDRFDALMICVDAEEREAATRRRDIEELVADAGGLPPRVELVIIIADCCIETWFLGNRRVCAPQPTSPELVAWRAFFNIRDEDPELLPQHPTYNTRSQTHARYLTDMLAERNLRYAKDNVQTVGAPDYLDALRERVRRTQHLASLRALLDVWDRWQAQLAARTPR